MKYSRRRRRSIWFWVGVIFLSISALFCLIVIAAAVAEAQDRGSVILAGLLFSIVPIGFGIYCVRRGKGRHRRRIYFL